MISHRRVFTTAAWLGVINAGGAALGFLFHAVMAYVYGAGMEMDALNAAMIIPASVTGIFASNAVVLLVPRLARRLAEGKPHEAAREANDFLAGALLFAAALLAAAGLAAPRLVRALAPGFDAATAALSVEVFWWLLPGSLFLTAAAAYGAVLQAHRKFYAASVAPNFYRMLVVPMAWALGPAWGVWAVVSSYTAAAAASVLALGRMASRRLPFREASFFKGRSWRNIARDCFGVLLAFRVLSLLNFSVVPNYYASLAGSGAVAAFAYAWALVNLPMSVAGSGVATVMFPDFSRLLAEGKREETGRALAAGLRWMALICIPATAFFFTLSPAVVEAVFERGAFGAEDTARVAAMLKWLAAGLVGFGMNAMLGNFLWAQQRLRLIAAIGAAGLCSNVAANEAVRRMGMEAEAVAGGLAFSLSAQAFFMAVFTWRDGYAEAIRIAGAALIRMSIAGLLMGMAIYAGLEWTKARPWWTLAAVVGGGAAAFVAVVWLFGGEEAREMKNAVRARCKPAEAKPANSVD